MKRTKRVDYATGEATSQPYREATAADTGRNVSPPSPHAKNAKDSRRDLSDKDQICAAEMRILGYLIWH